MNKKDRDILFNKYSGRCAYCGCELGKGWHADHIVPIRRGLSEVSLERMNKYTKKKIVIGTEDMDNYNPACRLCNIWKSTFDIEGFREEVKDQVRRANAYSNNYRNAKRFGLVVETNIEVKFYFETFIKK